MSGASTRALHVGEIDVRNTVQMIGIHGLDPTFRKALASSRTWKRLAEAPR